MKNFVKLVGYYGGDETHASSSFINSSNENVSKRYKLDEILDILSKSRNLEPFEKSSLHFSISCDLTTYLFLLNEKIGSININNQIENESFYIPSDLSYSMGLKLKHINEMSKNLYNEVIEKISGDLGERRAKEISNLFKMMNSKVNIDIILNFKEFYKFSKVIKDENVQKEVKEIAIQMIKLVKNINGNPFKLSMEKLNI